MKERKIFSKPKGLQKCLTILIIFALILGIFNIPVTQADSDTYSDGYDISTILSKYQYFVHENSSQDVHTVGSIVVGGQLNTSNTFGDAGICPSYVGELVNCMPWLASGPFSDSSLTNGNTLDTTVYYGTDSSSAQYTTWSNSHTWVQKSDYIDIDEAFAEITSQSKSVVSDTTVVADSNGQIIIDLTKGEDVSVTIPYDEYVKASKILIKLTEFDDLRDNTCLISITGVDGNNIELNGASKIGLLIVPNEYHSEASSAIKDVNGILKNMSFSTYGGQTNFYGMNLVWNLPDATGTVSTYGIGGHIVAPLSTVESYWNYDGGVIAKNFAGYAEGHFYPMSRPLTTANTNTTEAATEEATSTEVGSTTQETTSTEAVSTTQATTEVVSSTQGTTENSSVEVTTTQNVAGETTTQTATEEITSTQDTTEVVTSTQATTESSTTTQEVTTTENSSVEVTTTQTTAEEVSSTQATTEVVSSTQATTEISTTTQEVTTTEISSVEVTTTQTTAEEVSSAQATTEVVSSTQTTTEKVSSTQATTEEVSSTQTTVEEVSSTQTTTEEVSSTQATTEISTTTQEVTTTENSSVEVTTTQTTAEEVSSAQATTEEVSSTQNVASEATTQTTAVEVTTTQNAASEATTQISAVEVTTTQNAASETTTQIAAVEVTTTQYTASEATTQTTAVEVTTTQNAASEATTQSVAVEVTTVTTEKDIISTSENNISIDDPDDIDKSTDIKNKDNIKDPDNTNQQNGTNNSVNAYKQDDSTTEKTVLYGGLSIQILDEVTGKPVPNVTVTLKSSNGKIIELVTDSEGKISKDDIPVGAYTMYLSDIPEGYTVTTSYTGTLNVLEGEVTTSTVQIVSKDNDTTTSTNKNTNIGVQTGDSFNIIVPLAIFIFAAGMLFILIYLKKKYVK